MKPTFLLITLLAVPLKAAGPYKPPTSTSAEQKQIKGHYETAFRHYSGSHYSRAIQEWEKVLTVDTKQKTAVEMIKTAREKIDQRDKKEQDRMLRFVARGRYQRALVELQKLRERDSTHPVYLEWETRLEELMRVVPTAPKTRAWGKAVIGLTGWVARQDDLRLAHNGLRYAKEISPKDKRFRTLLELILDKDPGLARDKVPDGMKLIAHKKFIALNAIYDGKYNTAISNLTQVLQLEPKDVTALKRLGSAYYALKRYKQARQVWLRALTMAPGDRQLKRFLARTERRRRRRKAN
jgi:tetratricopeptide (TPR) repeat protein